MKEKTKVTMTTDPETIVRRAYHAAEGNVMDVQGFVKLFAHDGVIHAGVITPARKIDKKWTDRPLAK
jgi:hypothetical protein